MSSAALKLSRGCAKCYYKEHSCALHFHHVGKKDFDISQGLHKPKEVLNAEVAKCMVLCARCHSVFHYFFHQEEKGTWDWIQSRPGEVGQIEIWKGLNEDFVSGPHLEIDFGNSVECPLSELLSEPPLRPEDAVEKTDLDNPLLIASTGELALEMDAYVHVVITSIVYRRWTHSYSLILTDTHSYNHSHCRLDKSEFEMGTMHINWRRLLCEHFIWIDQTWEK